MSRGLIAYLVLVVLPAVLLGGFALRHAVRQRAMAVAEVEARTDLGAAEVARILGPALTQGFARAEDVVRATRQNGLTQQRPTEPILIRSAPGDYSYHRPVLRPKPPGAADLECYRRALEGGRSFEFVRSDPERAMDAYAFYLSRIESEELKARLRFEVARAVWQTGRRELACSIWKSLVHPSLSAVEHEGWPLWLLAGVRLEEGGRKEGGGSFLREVVSGRLALLSTAMIARVVKASGIDDTMVRSDWIEMRDRFEEAVERAIVLGRQALVYPGETMVEVMPRLVVVRPLDEEKTGELVACSVRIDARYVSHRTEPGGPRPGADIRLVATAAEATPSSAEAYVAVAPLRVEGIADPVGYAAVEDLGFGAAVAALDRQRLLQIVLVVLLLGTTVGSGLVLVLGFQRARRVARLREELLANVTHELKTPVTSIRMFAEMLARDPLDEARTRLFGKLLRGESLRLAGLIENVLDFARLERAGRELEREPVDVGELVRQVAEAFRFRAEEQGVEFRAEGGDAGADLASITHAPSVERILLNLLDNALKYRRPRSAAIELRARRVEDRLEVAVVDNGPGIPAAEQERIFEPFYRVQYDDYAIRGAGLGLAIARRLARQLGGELRVASRVGEGSTFVLELPAAANGEDAASEQDGR
ncbi:MAG: HAMP domain-containing histidine kinase [Planctomycetes bacterium]|nr:HAMP domain-containing histidine kinase [Planctomycetota bacterium]